MCKCIIHELFIELHVHETLESHNSTVACLCGVCFVQSGHVMCYLTFNFLCPQLTARHVGLIMAMHFTLMYKVALNGVCDFP